MRYNFEPKVVNFAGHTRTIFCISAIMSFTLIGCNGGASDNSTTSSNTATSSSMAKSSKNSQLSDRIGTLTTQNQYKIFVTKELYKGNFLKYESGSTTIQIADKLCNSDQNNPDKSKKYKALIGSSNRYVCDVSNFCGDWYSKDWPLMKNTEYVNIYGDTIFKTNNAAMFDFGELNSYLSALDTNIWTGLTSDWKTNEHTCLDWQSSNSDKNGRVGYTRSLNSISISDKQTSCDKARQLYCVQQPDITANPENADHSVPLDTTITVTFTKAFDPLTVNNETFTLTSESGMLVDGTIEISSDNKTAKFKPNANLGELTTYYVNLVNIQYIDGSLAENFSSTFKTEATGLLIFTSKDNYYGANIGSKTDADAICNKDAGSIATGNHKENKYKAMLSYAEINHARHACTSEGCGADYNIDWVLQPNQTYVNTLNEVIGKTSESAIFGEWLEHSILPSVKRVWTGFGTDWRSTKNCEDWKKVYYINNSGTEIIAYEGSLGTTKEYETFTSKILHTENAYCGNVGSDVAVPPVDASKAHLYCVEQNN